jgi:hypothetical protein
MKKTLLLFVSLACKFSIAQSLAPQVISTSGTSFNDGVSQLDWTLGEPAAQTFDNGSNLLTQGFEQPQLTVTAVNAPAADFELSIFPNPAVDYLQLHFGQLKDAVTVELYTTDGKLLFSRQYSESDMKIAMNEYAAGTYLLAVKNKRSVTKSYRIIKSH